MSIFVTTLWVLVVLCVILFLATRSALPSINDTNFKSFQRSYLVVYLLAMAGDWMQGPYVYALYESYGMSTHDIEVLFVAGFGSSMVFGTIVGSFADKYGRRANCILYGILYGLACVTKHFNNFWILMLGRLLGGIATSILYSAFESWLVYEYHKRSFPESGLGAVFSLAVLGNSIVAIGAGFVAQQAADVFGFVAPFDVSMVVLIVMIVLLVFTWTENYGDQQANIITSYKSAASAIKNDHKVLCLGLIQSLFEGSMYTFVLEWTPALTPAEKEHPTGSPEDDGHAGAIPHGLIFSAFMVAVMIGSSLYKFLSRYFTEEAFMRPVFFISALALSMPIIFPGNQLIVFIGFLVFEACVGVFWPSMGTMRSRYVPEATRATTMNFFRIPLNLIVVVILTQNLGMSVIFKCCVGFLLTACICQQWLYRLVLQLPKKMAAVPEGNEKEVPIDEKPLMDEESDA